LEGEVNYTQGALRYLYHTEDVNMDKASGANQAFGVADDCTYGGTVATGTATGCHLTTGWSAILAYEHYWTPQWHQSLVGAYMHVSYDGNANAILCSDAGNGNGLAGSLAVAAPGCDNDWSYWGVSSRLQWDVTKTFYLGVEVVYSKVESAHTSDGLLHGYALPAPAQPIFVANEDNLMVSVRAHRDFLP